MSAFFGPKSGATKPQYTGIQIQTSSTNVPLILAWGLNRMAPNIVWYRDFKSVKQKEKAGKGGGTITSYTYSASVILALCHGVVSGVDRVFRNQETHVGFASLGFTLITGETVQSPWGYLSSKYPAEAYSYPGVALLAQANYDLGQSATLPNHGFEVRSKRYNTAPGGKGDALPNLIIEDFFYDSSYGLGKPGIIVSGMDATGDATTTGDNAYETYCRAMGFGLSPVIASQEKAVEILMRWLQLTDASASWNGYGIRIVPNSFKETTGNGYHFVPDVEPVVVLTRANVLEAPRFSRTDNSKAHNIMRLNYNNRYDDYNSSSVDWKDQALIDDYGPNAASDVDASEICEPDMAAKMVALIGQRQAYVLTQAELLLPPHYFTLEPLDIIAYADEALGYTLLKIIEIEEDEEDGSISIVAEEAVPSVAVIGYVPDTKSGGYNTAIEAGPVNEPFIFEPPSSLTGGKSQLWAAISGADGDFDSLWGGAYLYISLNDVDYEAIGKIEGPSRHGVLTADLASYGGANPDTGNTLTADFGISGAEILSVTTTQASSGVSGVYLENGEILSYETATLVTGNEYDLDNLYRGLYSTGGLAATTGDKIVRLDEAVFKYDLPDGYLGRTLYLKAQSFNVWSNGLQPLEDCVTYAYSPSGAIPTAPANLSDPDGGYNWVGSVLTAKCDSIPLGLEYQFQIYRPDGTTLIRSINSSTPQMGYLSSLARTDGIEREYKIKVRARNVAGWGPYSSLVSFTNPAPTLVTGVTGTGGASDGQVSFDLMPDTDLSGYAIYYHTVADFDPADAGIVIYNNGVPDQFIYGMAPATYYARVAAFDEWTRHPDFLNVSDDVSFTITTGGYNPPNPGGGGGYCVTEDTMIAMHDGVLKEAGQIVPGDLVFTAHETTMTWGIYPVEAVSVVDCDDVWSAVIGDQTLRASRGHKVFIDNKWTSIADIGTPSPPTRVVKITVTDAHTYVSNGVLSHNAKQNEVQV